MPQEQRVDERVAQLADPHLQRAAIAHQRAGIEANGVLGGGERRIGWREQVIVVARVIDDEVELLGRELRRPAHEGHLRVRLADHDDVTPRASRLRDQRQQVGGDVRV